MGARPSGYFCGWLCHRCNARRNLARLCRERWGRERACLSEIRRLRIASRVPHVQDGSSTIRCTSDFEDRAIFGAKKRTALLKLCALGCRCFQKVSRRAECLLQRAVLATRATFAQLQQRTNGFCESEAGMPRATGARGTAVFGVSSASYWHCRSCLISHHNGCGPPYGLYLRQLVGLMSLFASRLCGRCSLQPRLGCKRVCFAAAYPDIHWSTSRRSRMSCWFVFMPLATGSEVAEVDCELYAEGGIVFAR